MFSSSEGVVSTALIRCPPLQPAQFSIRTRLVRSSNPLRGRIACAAVEGNQPNSGRRIFSERLRAPIAQELVKQEGSLAAYVWRFEPKASELSPPQTASVSAASIAMSKDLKRRGWPSSAPPPSTLSCRRWAWSTIMPRAASSETRRQHPGQPFGVRPRPSGLKPHPYIRLSPGSRS